MDGALVTVSYTRPRDMTLARRCQRCDGTGRERHIDAECPRCDATGIRAEGWDYWCEFPVKVGDRVLVPSTPYSAGRDVEVTVIGVRQGEQGSHKVAIRRLNAGDMEGGSNG